MNGKEVRKELQPSVITIESNATISKTTAAGAVEVLSNLSQPCVLMC